jgi:general secretion pathway protein L
MMLPDKIIAMLPVAEGDDPTLWLMEGDSIVDQGALSKLRVDLDVEPEQLEAIPLIAIVPAECSSFRRIEGQGLEPQQEIAVARITAQQEAIGTVHAAAALDDDGKLAIATVDRAVLEAGVQRLTEAGFMVTAALPLAAIAKPENGQPCRLELGGHAVLRALDFACADEPALAETLFAGQVVPSLTDAQIDAALVAVARQPAPDFLVGIPVRKARKPLLDAVQRRWAIRLAALAVALYVLAMGIHWGRLQWAISSENQRALAAAQTVAPTISEIGEAEAAIDAALARKGIERVKPAMLSAILWQSARSSENLAISNLEVGDDGLLKATLAAPDAATINGALLSIQRAGYRITATPRSDPSGTTLADLTMRAP